MAERSSGGASVALVAIFVIVAILLLVFFLFQGDDGFTIRIFQGGDAGGGTDGSIDAGGEVDPGTDAGGDTGGGFITLTPLLMMLGS